MVSIDTITLSTRLKYYDYEVITKEFDTSKRGKHLVYFLNYKDLRFTYYIGYKILHIRTTPEKLIGESLTDKTFKKFEKVYNETLYEIFEFIEPLDEQALNRIDYKIDYYTKEKDLYLKLLKKAKKEYRYLDREKEYNSSVYYKSKSRNINVYDKEQYCIDKNKGIEKTKQYKDCIRYEVQIKANKIRYNFRKWGLIPCLFNYIDLYDMNYFLNDILTPVIYKGDYYNLYHSEKILLDNHKRYMVDRLLELQKKISLKGVQDAKKDYTSSTFKNYIDILQDANINPIPIPKNAGIPHLENPINIIAS